MPDRPASFFTCERRLLEALTGEAKGAAATALRRAGYRQHARGAWRLSRKRALPMSDEANALPVEPRAATRSETLAKLDRLVEEARHCPELAREYFDLLLKLGVRTEQQLIEQMRGDPIPIIQGWYITRFCAKDDYLEREDIRRHIARLRADLLAGSDSPTECIIVDRAVTCYLAVQDAERNLARLQKKGEQPRLPDQKRLDYAQRRLLDCLKALDQIRRKTPAARRLSVAVMGDLCLSLSPEGDAPGAHPMIDLPTSPTPIEDQR